MASANNKSKPANPELMLVDQYWDPDKDYHKEFARLAVKLLSTTVPAEIAVSYGDVSITGKEVAGVAFKITKGEIVVVDARNSLGAENKDLYAEYVIFPAKYHRKPAIKIFKGPDKDPDSGPVFRASLVHESTHAAIHAKKKTSKRVHEVIAHVVEGWYIFRMGFTITDMSPKNKLALNIAKAMVARKEGKVPDAFKAKHQNDWKQKVDETINSSLEKLAKMIVDAYNEASPSDFGDMEKLF